MLSSTLAKMIIRSRRPLRKMYSVTTVVETDAASKIGDQVSKAKTDNTPSRPLAAQSQIAARSAVPVPLDAALLHIAAMKMAVDTLSSSVRILMATATIWRGIIAQVSSRNLADCPPLPRAKNDPNL